MNPYTNQALYALRTRSILLVTAVEGPPESSDGSPCVLACDINAGMPSIFLSPAERDRGRLAVPSETVPRLSLMAETMSIICGVSEFVMTLLVAPVAAELVPEGSGTGRSRRGGVSSGYSFSYTFTRASSLLGSRR